MNFLFWIAFFRIRREKSNNNSFIPLRHPGPLQSERFQSSSTWCRHYSPDPQRPPQSRLPPPGGSSSSSSTPLSCSRHWSQPAAHSRRAQTTSDAEDRGPLRSSRSVQANIILETWRACHHNAHVNACKSWDSVHFRNQDREMKTKTIKKRLFEAPRE